MKVLIFILSLIIFTMCDDYTISIKSNPTLGSISVDNHKLTYSHTDTTDIRRATLDSISIIVTDDSDTLKDTSELFILIIPKFELDLYIIPNPMTIIGSNVKCIDKGVMDKFDISVFDMGDKGSALIVLFDRSIDKYNSSGRIKIFDPVGNPITSYMNIKFGTTDDGQDIGVCVWDGMNENNRLVGASGYAMYIELHVKSDIIIDNETNSIDQSFMKVVGVKYER